MVGFYQIGWESSLWWTTKISTGRIFREMNRLYERLVFKCLFCLDPDDPLLILAAEQASSGRDFQ